MVYLLCFDKKFKHARHYIGFAENQRTFELRMKHHAKGNGSKLMAAVAKAGIGFTVARTWPDGDRNFERKLKNRKEGPRLCPLCVSRAKSEKLRQKHIEHLKANPLSPEHQAAVDELSTPEGFSNAFKMVDDIVEGNVSLDPKIYDKPLMCPVVKKFDESKSIFNVVMQEKPDPIASAVVPLTGDVIMLGEIYAKPKSDPNTSRWQRVWSCVARLLGFS